MREIKKTVAPSDGSFWAGVALGTAAVVGVGAIICC